MIGALVSIIAVIFVQLVEAANGVSAFDEYRYIEIGLFILDLQVIVLISLAALCILFIRYWFNITRWHGPADSIYAAHQDMEQLDLKTGLASTLAALASAVGNASVGQYGPLVHFGATAGSAIKKILNIKASTDIVIGCGVAAAISAGFDAPIAGIIFAHEAILRHYSPSAMTPIATSSIVATTVNNYLFDTPHQLALTGTTPSLMEALIPVVISGIVFGFIAILFMNCLRFFAMINNITNQPIYRSLCVAVLAVIGVSIFMPEALGLGTRTLAGLLQTDNSFAFALSLLVGKIFITSICLGFGFFGGVFSPSLLIGASTGVILAKLFSILGFENLSVSLALAGMASVAACVIGAPLATIFIVLELTLSYNFTLITLLAVIVSQVISSNLFGNSFFDKQLLDRDIDLQFGRSQLDLEQKKVCEWHHADYVSAKAQWTAKKLLEKLKDKQQTEAYCITDEGILEGKINVISLLDCPEDTILKEIMDTNPISLFTDDTMVQAIKIASNFVGESIPVLHPETSKMVGIVTESDLFTAYLDVQNRVHNVEK